MWKLFSASAHGGREGLGNDVLICEYHENVCGEEIAPSNAIREISKAKTNQPSADSSLTNHQSAMS